MLATIIQAVGLFVATNIDDVIVCCRCSSLVALAAQEPRDASSWVSTWDSWASLARLS